MKTKLKVLALTCILAFVLAVPVSASSAPWIIYYKELYALFGEDPAILLDYDEEANEVTLLVEGDKKADALTQLLPAEKTFGNVTMKITVIPANGDGEKKVDLIEAAFDGNPVVTDICRVPGISGTEFDFVLFENKVVQYWSDNLADLNGLTSTLYQEVAKDVLGEEFGVFYCTAPGFTELNAPLGEWP